MASLYSNENFPKRVVEELRRLGHDVLTSYEAGQANQKIPDQQVLEFAIARNRAVLTLNRIDFIRLHQETRGVHAGIIVCTRDDANPLAFAGRINAVLINHPDPAGRLIRIVRPAKNLSATVAGFPPREWPVNVGPLHDFQASQGRFHPPLHPPGRLRRSVKERRTPIRRCP